MTYGLKTLLEATESKCQVGVPRIVFKGSVGDPNTQAGLRMATLN